MKVSLPSSSSAMALAECETMSSVTNIHPVESFSTEDNVTAGERVSERTNDNVAATRTKPSPSNDPTRVLFMSLSVSFSLSRSLSLSLVRSLTRSLARTHDARSSRRDASSRDTPATFCFPPRHSRSSTRLGLVTSVIAVAAAGSNHLFNA